MDPSALAFFARPRRWALGLAALSLLSARIARGQQTSEDSDSTDPSEKSSSQPAPAGVAPSSPCPRLQSVGPSGISGHLTAGTPAHQRPTTLCEFQGNWHYFSLLPAPGDLELAWSGGPGLHVAIGWGPCQDSPRHCPTQASFSLPQWPDKAPLWVALAVDPKALPDEADPSAKDQASLTGGWMQDPSSSAPPDEGEGSSQDGTQPPLPLQPFSLSYTSSGSGPNTRCQSPQDCGPGQRCVQHRCQRMASSTCANATVIEVLDTPQSLDLGQTLSQWGDDLPTLCTTADWQDQIRALSRPERVFRLALKISPQRLEALADPVLRLQLWDAPGWSLALWDKGSCSGLWAPGALCAETFAGANQPSTLVWPAQGLSLPLAQALGQEPFVVLEGPTRQPLPAGARFLVEVLSRGDL